MSDTAKIVQRLLCRRESRSPDDVAAELSDEEILKGPMGPLFQGLKVQILFPPLAMPRWGHILCCTS